MLLADAVEKISEITGADDIPKITRSLIGVAWDEEDAGEIISYLQEDDY